MRGGGGHSEGGGAQNVLPCLDRVPRQVLQSLIKFYICFSFC